MIHIVFQEADVAILEKAIEMDETLDGKVLQVKDDFAVGPLEQIYSEEGIDARKEWWKKLLVFSPYTNAINEVNDNELVEEIIQQCVQDASTEIWIWIAPNAHDRCGYYWLICQLENILPNIKIVYTGNLPFINEKGGIFYPTALFEIQPSEFKKAKILAGSLTTSAFEAIRDDWNKLCASEDLIRVLEDEKIIVGKPVDYFDKKILSAINTEPQKLNKILMLLLGKMNIKTGDVFLVWRIREMCKEEIIFASGNWENGWKEITIQLPANQNGQMS